MTDQIHAHTRISALLAELADESAGALYLRLGKIFDYVGERGFGLLLLLLALPNFIPAPIGVGAVTGPIASFCGLQLLFGLSRPWMPRRMRSMRLKRATFQRMLGVVGKLLRGLEKLSRPRWDAMVGDTALRITGFLLVGLGVALALPIPFTNYPFGGILLLLSIALMERDGVLMAICWALMIGAIAAAAGLSGAAIAMISGWMS
ncbi:MAG: exopolysaccharide biosynthesis protein [Lysobacterales bacterium]